MESTKQWWGPRIWRILHRMAEFSDRSGCGLPWRTVLRSTLEILPCEICKAHFRAAIGTLSLVQPRPAADMRSLLRHFLWNIHTSSATVGISEESLSELYGGDRAFILQSVREEARVLEEAFRRLHVLDRMHEGSLRPWIHSIDHLAHLLSLPEVVSNRRRR